MGRFAMLYDPSFCVVAFTVRPVPRFFTCTMAVPTTAFDVSVTVPLIEPSVCCAFVANGRHAERISSRKIERLILSVISFPTPKRFSAFTTTGQRRQAVLWISRPYFVDCRRISRRGILRAARYGCLAVRLRDNES